MRGRNRNGGGGGGGGGGGRGPNPLQRSYESNGPDVKVRGTAQHIAEKYAQLARDSQSSGDPVMAESYFQHAEHYWRIVLAAQEQMTQQYGHQFQPARPFGEEGEDGDDEGDDEGGPYPAGADQPVGPGQMGNPDDQPYSQDTRGPRENQNRNDNRGDRNENRGDRNGQRFDRNDRNNNDRNNRRFDRQGGGGQGGDRNNNERPNNDRQSNDRNERFGRDRDRFERPRRDDQNGEQPRFENQDQPSQMQPERAQQAEVEGRQPRAVIDADASSIGLPSFVTQPRRKTIEIDADQQQEAPAAEAAEAAPRRRGRPPGARNKPKAEAEGTAE
ncbi:MAG: DUF4167 domain-containing protein [Bosea sp. (in: a-proteobacteria)]